ncbi:pentapeptide repeat-containing protein [Nocardia vinacea]|uniref:pentapeptide repeat-containing protein n=1 Tax=Nocardia vinacea TaxID=96468 RepID=UPI00343ED79C
MTVVAGVGGVVALVIAYRRQRDLEQSRFVERFGAAAAQLGATDVAVRIAGVYAMAGVADESDGLRRQQCIDVLCGYLRLPYSPDLGANHQSKLVLKHHRATADGTRADDEERHLEYRHNDREVRATIVRVIADHLRPTAEYSWSTSDFDFRTAYLENVDFSRAKFLGSARFGEATFSGAVTSFADAIFSGTASFDGATFSNTASFADATFSDSASFVFVIFSGTALFYRATFSSDVSFLEATFSAGKFDGAIFSGIAVFSHATFASTASFDSATFSNDVFFIDATFSSTASFDSATFSGTTMFIHVTFASTASFSGVTFSGSASFSGVTFSGTTVFVDPKQWGPPAPRFDWDQDISQKPANIEPQNWPPSVVAAA